VNSNECGLSLGDWQSEYFISGTGKAADMFQAIVLISVAVIDWFRRAVLCGDQ
jgi:hypothetical protein